MYTIIKNALANSISYQEYKDLVTRLVENNSTTGLDKSEAMINYTMLNDRRMKRWDKTIKVSDETKTRLNDFTEKITWLVITESWCGDAAHIMPVINKVAQLNKNIDYRVVLRDENNELMSEFLTHGARSIPKLIMLDNSTGEVINTYGPRPSEATKMVNEFKVKHGKLTPEFKEDIQRWYNKNKGQNIIEDLTEMLCQLDTSVCL